MGVEHRHSLCGTSLGNRKDFPCLAFGTSGKIELQLGVFQGCTSPENFERRSRRTVAPRGDGRKHSPGVLWGFELVDGGTGGGFEDDTIENVVVGGEREIHGRLVYGEWGLKMGIKE